MQDIRMQLQPHLNQLHKSTKSETLLASRDFTNETSRNLATMALALISLLVAMISAAIAWMNHVQSSRTKAVKDEAESDLVALREATDRELIELQMNTQRQINSLTERHENDIVRLTQDHKEEVRRLEQLNLDKVQHAETAFENLMGETETQNGLIFKNLAVSIYLRRFLVEDGYDRFFNDLTLISIDETATVRCDPSILREVISIQEHAISRFEKVKNKLEDAKMLYYEALLDLAFYEAEMSRFGILNVDATQRINENLVAFEQNVLFWLNEERSEYKTPERLPRFIFRVICMVDSLVFIRGCLKLHEISEEKPAKDEMLSQVSALLVENDMATVRQITDVIDSNEYSSLWSKYTNFKEERPKLFEY